MHSHWLYYEKLPVPNPPLSYRFLESYYQRLILTITNVLLNLPDCLIQLMILLKHIQAVRLSGSGHLKILFENKIDKVSMFKMLCFYVQNQSACDRVSNLAFQLAFFKLKLASPGSNMLKSLELISMQIQKRFKSITLQ